MKFDIPSGIKTLKSVVTANSPALLVGVAASGIVVSGVLAAKAGYKARGIIDAAETDRDISPTNNAPLTTKEKVQLTWLCYVPSALTATTALASVAGVHLIHTRRYAALAGLYAVATTKLDDMKVEAEKLLGPKKTQQFQDAVAQSQVNNGPPLEDNEVVITPHGQDLMHDQLTGRTFTGSMNKVEDAINRINHQLATDGDATLNEFYNILGLKNVPMGEDLGWSGELIEAKYGSVLLSDGRAAVDVSFLQEPKLGANRLG